MAAGQYSAGTIFLQVVPVFRDTMDRIQNESKKLSRAIGDDLEESGRDGGKRASAAYSKEMEKGAGDAGDKAGKAYAGAFESNIKKSINSAQREIDRLDFSTASDSSIKDLDRVKRKLTELKDVDFSVDFNAKKVLADVAIVEAAVKKMASGDHEINITANAQKVLADLRSIAAAAESVEKKRREIRFEGKADFKPLERQVGAFEKKFRNSMRSAADSLGDHLGPEIAKVRAELDSLSDVEIGIDMDASQALARAAALKAELETLAGRKISIDAELDTGAAIAQLGAFDRKIETVERSAGAFEKKFSAAMRKASDSIGDGLGPEIDRIKARLATLADAKIGVDLDAGEAMAQAQGLEVALKFLTKKKDVDIDVDVDLGAALAQIVLLNAALKKTQREAAQTAATTSILGAAMAAFSSKSGGASSSADQGANAFRSFNFVILAAVTLLPALVPVLGAVGGGLLALIPILGALGAGLGVAILGFSGIGNAVKELGSVADEQATASSKAKEGAKQVAAATHAVADAERALADARRNAARAAQDAARAVADARESAAEAIEAAIDRQKDAQEEYRDAVKDVADAEADLRQARADAAADAADLATRQRKNAVDERQAVLDLGEAQNTYNAVMGDGSSTTTEKEQASVNLEQAQIALNDTRTEQVALADEAADYAKNGVEGSDKVKTAQDSLTEALEAQKDAQEAVKEAAEDTRQVQIDAARDVEDALRNQRRTAADSARAIADAQRALARAHEGVGEAVQAAADEGSAAMDRLQLAMDKLSPAGRKFARFIFGLRGGFKEVRDEVQERMLPGVQRGLQAIIDEYGPKFKNFAGNVAESLGKIGEDAGKGLGNDSFQKFFKTYGKLVPRLIESFAASSGSWMNAWAGLFTTIAPYAERLAGGLEKMAEHADKFFNSAKGKKDVQEFMDYAFKVGPDVVRFFKDLATFAKDLAKAMAPLGDVILNALSGLFEFISGLDPKTLQLILTVMIGLVIAFQLAVGAVALVVAGGAIIGSTFASIVFVIVAVAFALVALYNRFPIFKKIVDTVIKAVVKAWNWLKDVIVDKVIPPVMKALGNFWDGIKYLWDKIVKPYLTLLIDFWSSVFMAIVWVIQTFVMPILEVFWNGIKFLWDKIIKPYLGFILGIFTSVFKAIWWTIKNLFLPILELMIKGVAKLWKDYIKPYVAGMKTSWEEFAASVRKAWNDHIQPILDKVGDYISDEVAPKFQTAVDTIKGIWESLKEAFAVPVRFLINTVINGGLIDGFNWVADKVGSTHIKYVPVPDWAQEKTSKATGGMLPWGNQNRAVGGVLPGYTPGRDVHSFYNPQLGQLNLSGGEGILRPEVVAAAGGEPWLNSLNGAAITGGVQGVRKKMFGAFARGGKVIFPVRGGYIEKTDYNTTHDGVDINHVNDASGNVPFFSATSGQVTTTGYDRGYGNAVFINTPYGEIVYGHGVDGSIKVSPGDPVNPGTLLANIGSTGNASGAHLHFGIPGSQGGTYARAMAILEGSAPLSATDVNIAQHKAMPEWAKNILANPLGWLKGLINKPLDSMREKFGNTDLTRLITGVPKELARRSVKFIKDLIPNAGEGFDKLIGNSGPGDNLVAPGQENGLPGQQGSGSSTATGLWKGGILPYNGTMKYDAGGYLPPGLTSVVNLTGKPEPVFTADQFEKIPAAASGDGFTYSPTINGSKLTAADLVDDMDFQRRKIRREGKYGRTL